MFIISPLKPNVTVTFKILENLLPELQEFFTGSISTDDEFVKNIVPTTRIIINDNDGNLYFVSSHIINLAFTSR